VSTTDGDPTSDPSDEATSGPADGPASGPADGPASGPTDGPDGGPGAAAPPPGLAPPGLAPPGLAPPADAAARPSVSLLGVVRDDVDGVRDQVESMVGSDYPDLEVIVVDDASADGTADVLYALALELGITVVLHDLGRGRPRCLRAAAARAGGEVLAVADPRLVLRADAVEQAVSPLIAGRSRGTVRWRAHGVTAHLAAAGRAAIGRAAGADVRSARK
jgi:Glycosyl transferase family 2